ncbi:MAG TPA: MnhB domain-containing protein, partial [Cellulomonas sp.]
ALLAGGSVLQSWIIDIHAPLIGDIHLVTSLFFDIGVYLVVVGLVLDMLRSLGAEIDRQSEADGEVADAVGGDADPGEEVRLDPALIGLARPDGSAAGRPAPDRSTGRTEGGA